MVTSSSKKLLHCLADFRVVFFRVHWHLLRFHGLKRKRACGKQRRHSELAYLFTSVAALEIQENEKLLVYILKAFTLNSYIQNPNHILKCRVKWQWFWEFLCIFMCTFALPESLQVFNTLMMFPIFSSLFYGL